MTPAARAAGLHWGRERFPWQSHRTMLDVALTEQLRDMRSQTSRKVWVLSEQRWRLEELEARAIEPGNA